MITLGIHEMERIDNIKAHCSRALYAYAKGQALFATVEDKAATMLAKHFHLSSFTSTLCVV